MERSLCVWECMHVKDSRTVCMCVGYDGGMGFFSKQWKHTPWWRAYTVNTGQTERKQAGGSEQESKHEINILIPASISKSWSSAFTFDEFRGAYSMPIWLAVNSIQEIVFLFPAFWESAGSLGSVCPCWASVRDRTSIRASLHHLFRAALFLVQYNLFHYSFCFCFWERKLPALSWRDFPWLINLNIRACFFVLTQNFQVYFSETVYTKMYFLHCYSLSFLFWFLLRNILWKGGWQWSPLVPCSSTQPCYSLETLCVQKWKGKKKKEKNPFIHFYFFPVSAIPVVKWIEITLSPSLPLFLSPHIFSEYLLYDIYPRNKGS